eukprot:6378492-Amphidinium_carterae.1
MGWCSLLEQVCTHHLECNACLLKCSNCDSPRKIFDCLVLEASEPVESGSGPTATAGTSSTQCGSPPH